MTKENQLKNKLEIYFTIEKELREQQEIINNRKRNNKEFWNKEIKQYLVERNFNTLFSFSLESDQSVTYIFEINKRGDILTNCIKEVENLS